MMAGMYLTYVVLCVGVTIWVGRTLRTYGSVFLVDGHEERAEIAEALSHLLVIGFYLINFGVISYALKSSEQALDLPNAIELLSTKVGLILLVTGGMHFFVLAALASIRRTNEKAAVDAARQNHLAELTALRRNAAGTMDPL